MKPRMHVLNHLGCPRAAALAWHQSGHWQSFGSTCQATQHLQVPKRPQCEHQDPMPTSEKWIWQAPAPTQQSGLSTSGPTAGHPGAIPPPAHRVSHRRASPGVWPVGGGCQMLSSWPCAPTGSPQRPRTRRAGALSSHMSTQLRARAGPRRGRLGPRTHYASWTGSCEDPQEY